MDQEKVNEAREIFQRLYDIFRRRNGSKDRFEDHPGFHKRTGKHTSWERLAAAADEWRIELPGYIYTALKKLMEGRGDKEIHPHFLLSPALLEEYKKIYPTVIRDIEIRWRDQQLLFDAEMKNVNTMPWLEGTTENYRERYVLLMGSSFDSMFYFYRAVLCGAEEVAAQFEWQARLEYSLFPALYDGIIKKKKVLERLRGKKEKRN
jgi:hypothetical protein